MSGTLPKALRAFVPAKDFAASKRFYQDLGFELVGDSGQTVALALGDTSFLLQDFYRPGFAENFMMQMVVTDIEDWWRRIEALDMAARHDVKPPLAPQQMPWNARVIFLTDPSGVLWHITERVEQTEEPAPA